jgi:hypothetical protein
MFFLLFFAFFFLDLLATGSASSLIFLLLQVAGVQWYSVVFIPRKAAPGLCTRQTYSGPRSFLMRACRSHSLLFEDGLFFTSRRRIRGAAFGFLHLCVFTCCLKLTLLPGSAIF